MGEVDQFCRFCTQIPHRSRRRNLFETENSQLLEIAMRCIPMPMAASDRYSNFTCYPCAYKLNDIAKFQSNGLSAVNFFEEFLAEKEKHSSTSAEYCPEASAYYELFEETEMDSAEEFAAKLETRFEKEIEVVDPIEDEADLFVKHDHTYHMNKVVFVNMMPFEYILPAMESMPTKQVENVPLGVDEESSSENQGNPETDNKQINNVGSTTKPFFCDQCNKTFKWKSRLIIHHRVHSGEKPFECGYCKKCFKTTDNLKYHLRIHTGEKPFECGYCKKCFTRMGELKNHIRIHTGEKPFECEYCMKSFGRKTSLVNHVRIHSNVKPFECEYCKKNFRHRNTLVDHVRTHTGEKPFECEYCKKNFRHRNTLLHHVRTHTGEKWFVCEYCNIVFGCIQTLVNHVKSHNG